ncbi:unnamed protein product [Mytilus coruscus]|uniref:Uncharacterized protein n=1 Tax=Mytilus coruscus TaxID=42192 RepID=A0A6J8D017_MYTCO|nr:unnamed protein product [Mytilus coruscus]
MENIERAVIILIIICSVVNGRDFNTVESSFNVKGSDSTENIQTTYNILIYNDHIPSQNFRRFGSRLMFPELTLGSEGSTFDTNLRHSRSGQFDGHSELYKEPHDIESRNPYPSFSSNGISDNRYHVKKPAQMLFNLLQNYGSFSDSDFSTVYKQWFGL